MSKAQTLATTVSTGNVLADGTVAYSEVSGTPVIGTDIQAYDADTVKYDDELTRPDIRPSLNLDFANTKRLDPRITFTRSTTASYYDGVTTAKAEENLLTYSQQFDVSANWTPNGTNISGNTVGTTAPDGTSTADKIEETATTQAHWVQQIAATSGLVYTVSVFLKSAEKTYALISNGTNHAITVDLTAGTAANATGTTSNVTCTSVGNSWFRVSFTFTASATNLNFYSSSDGVWANRSYLGVAGEGIYIWGAQLEQRSAVSAYTPTTTQPITNYIPVLQTAASGVARFDHNPTTGESLGLLVEEQRTNLLTYSEEFDNAAWIKTRSSTTSNTIVAPDGTLTGDKLVENTETNTHLINQSQSLTTGNKYTVSIFAKAAERTQLRFQFGTSAGAFSGLQSVDFDLSTLTTTAANNAVGSITPVGNGWYRCVMTTDTTIATDSTNIRIVLLTAEGASYEGDGYSGLFIWGSQFEVGAFPTSYIPTTSATVTRNADTASMTGTNFSSWYRQDEGTLYSDFTMNGIGSPLNAVFSMSDGTANNRIQTRYNVLFGRNFVTTNNVGQGNMDGAAVSTGTPVKISFAYKTNDCAASQDGAAVAVDTSVTLPTTIDRAHFGVQVSTGFLNGYLSKIAYYPSRLPNAQLQALTS